MHRHLETNEVQVSIAAPRINFSLHQQSLPHQTLSLTLHLTVFYFSQGKFFD